MAYLTDSKLRNSVDLPIALPTTTVKQSDYLVVATVKLLTAQRLALRSLNLELAAGGVDPATIDASNLIISNLGLAYVVLRKDYVSGVPGDTGALDYIFIQSAGVVTRSTTPAIFTAPGNYSVIVANNMQPSDTSPIPTTTAIDWKLTVTGGFRLELSVA